MRHSRLRPLWKAFRGLRPDRALVLTVCVVLGLLADQAAAQVHGGGAGGDGRPAAAPVRDVALFRGRPEFIALSPPGAADAAVQVLTDAGAQLLRSRALPGFGLEALVFDFRGRLSLGQAQAALGQQVPAAVIDANALYRPAQGAPRLYAAALVGTRAPGGCRVGPVRVGIIDGPVSTAHPALAGARLTTFSTLLATDRASGAAHGTAVAALVVGEDSSGALSGFAPGAHLFAVTAFAADRAGPAADVERIGAALDVLERNDVRLVNMSFAGPGNRALDRLIEAAAARGLVMVAAAGNDASARPVWPAAAGPVIGVTAIDAARRRYARANTGAHVEFAAPGVDLFVATATGGAYASGTSYAAPIVTALAAQAIARGTAARAVRDALRARAEDLGPPGRDTAFGWGLPRAGGC